MWRPETGKRRGASSLPLGAARWGASQGGGHRQVAAGG